MRYWLFLLALIIGFGGLSPAFGQRIITGTVTDAETGEPLIGANVLIGGTSSGTITDFDGKYELDISEETEMLEFSYTGYGPKTVAISNLNVIDVQLSAGRLLDEVVVVGYGTQKKKDISSAIESLSAEDVKDVPSASFEAARKLAVRPT